jgi:hypothetical protein
MAEPRVGQVDQISFSHYEQSKEGFVVFGNDGRPAATFGFASRADARTAVKKMSEIIALCTNVRGNS